MYQNNGNLVWNHLNHQAPNKSGASGGKATSWALPEGEYIAEVQKVEIRQSSTSPWGFLQIKFEVLSPAEFKSKLVFQNYFIQHPELDTSADIQSKVSGNYRQLEKIFAAVGCQGSTNEEDLVGKRLYIKLKFRAGKPKTAGGTDKWPDGNDVIDARPFNRVQPAQGLPPMRQPVQAAPVQRESTPLDLDDPLPF